MRTLLIDGDILAYQFASNAEVAVDWGDDLWTLHAYPGPAKEQLEAYIENLRDDLEAKKIIIALSDPTGRYFRKDILPTYKSNRKNRKPLILSVLKEHLEAVYGAYVRPGLEADDCLGILATAHKIIPGEKVIVSLDKDLKTIPGLHYRMDGKAIFEVEEKEADYWHLYQTLVGDAVDGFSGCPGVGPVKASEILGEEPTWEAVVAAYRKAKLTEEDALIQARVARICRASDYDFKAKKVKLWTP